MPPLILPAGGGINTEANFSQQWCFVVGWIIGTLILPLVNQSIDQSICMTVKLTGAKSKLTVEFVHQKNLMDFLTLSQIFQFSILLTLSMKIFRFSFAYLNIFALIVETCIFNLIKIMNFLILNFKI